MAKNKFVVSLMLAALLMLPVSAEVKLDDVTTPKDIFYRLGTTDTPENKIDVITVASVKRPTYFFFLLIIYFPHLFQINMNLIYYLKM